MRINLYNESHLKRPAVLSALPPKYYKSHLKARKYWAREIFALLSRISRGCLSSATPGPNSMFHFLYSTSQSEVEWALGIVSGHIWSGDHLLTMATPIERLNTGKKPLCQICVQRKKPSMSNMATLPLCCFRFSSTSYLSRLLLLLWLTIHSSPMERKSWCQIWIVLSHAVSSSAATPLYVRQNGKWVCCYFALFLIPPNPHGENIENGRVAPRFI